VAGLGDEELLQRVGAGDSEAFGEIWARYSRPVLGLALRVLGERSAAEDATQDAFAAVWRGAHRYRPERGPAAPWIFTVARNAALDQARRRRIAPVPDAGSGEAPDPGPGPEDLAAADRDAFLVHTAVAGLSPRAREVIELAYFGGLSQTEIAERTGTPLGTVKTRTRNALMQLADVLAAEAEL
jgi:RNA polymerase sigma-70 factor (ECF subfamily)